MLCPFCFRKKGRNSSPAYKKSKRNPANIERHRELRQQVYIVSKKQNCFLFFLHKTESCRHNKGDLLSQRPNSSDATTPVNFASNSSTPHWWTFRVVNSWHGKHTYQTKCRPEMTHGRKKTWRRRSLDFSHKGEWHQTSDITCVTGNYWTPDPTREGRTSLLHHGPLGEGIPCLCVHHMYLSRHYITVMQDVNLGFIAPVIWASIIQLQRHQILSARFPVESVLRYGISVKETVFPVSKDRMISAHHHSCRLRMSMHKGKQPLM